MAKNSGRKSLQELYGLTDAAAVARYTRLREEYRAAHDGQCGAAAEGVIGTIAYMDQLLHRCQEALQRSTLEASPRGGQREKKELSQLLRISRAQAGLMQSIGLIRGKRSADGEEADDAPDEEDLEY